MSRSFDCFLLAAGKERENTGTFNSVLNSLPVQNNLSSVQLQGIYCSSLDTLLNSVEAGNNVDNVVHSDEYSVVLNSEVDDEIMSRGQVGSGTNAKRVITKPQNNSLPNKMWYLKNI